MLHPSAGWALSPGEGDSREHLEMVRPRATPSGRPAAPPSSGGAAKQTVPQRAALRAAPGPPANSHSWPRDSPELPGLSYHPQPRSHSSDCDAKIWRL